MGSQKNFSRTLLASASRTASGTLDFEVPFGSRGHFFLDVTAASGTLPTLDIDVGAVDPLGLFVTNLRSFSQLTAVSTGHIMIGHPSDTVFLSFRNRLTWTLGGTAPDFTFSITASLDAD